MRRSITLPIPLRPLELAIGGALFALAVAVWPSQAADPVSETENAGPLTLRLEAPLLAPGADETTLLVEVTAPETARPVEEPAALALVIDTSTSMSGNKLVNARRAARETVLAMADDDRLTLVAFDTSARILIDDGLVGPRRTRMLDAIDRLESAGSTCIACGLHRAWTALRGSQTAGARTVLLISDGDITHGIADPAVLRALARDAAAEDIRTTAVGLGRDYDPVSLQAVAGGGEGAFYFAHNSALLGGYARHELQLARRGALSATQLVIRPTAGLKLSPPRNGGALGEDGTLRVTLGRLTPGELRRVLVPVRLEANAEVGAVHAQVEARGVRGPWFVEAPKTTLARTADRAAALEMRDLAVTVEREQRAAADRLDAALDALGRGESAAARRDLRDLVRRLSALRRTSGDAGLDEPLAATRDVLANLAEYAPGSNALITAQRANAGVQFERDRGMVDDMNSLNRGGGFFDARDLE